MEQVIAMFHRDARSTEIMEVLNDLRKTGQIHMQQAKTGKVLVSATFSKQNTEDSMMNLLMELVQQ